MGKEGVHHPDLLQAGVQPGGRQLGIQLEGVAIEIRDGPIPSVELSLTGAAPESPQPGEKRRIGKRPEVER
jgi:hypothetical protein